MPTLVLKPLVLTLALCATGGVSLIFMPGEPDTESEESDPGNSTRPCLPLTASSTPLEVSMPAGVAMNSVGVNAAGEEKGLGLTATRDIAMGEDIGSSVAHPVLCTDVFPVGTPKGARTLDCGIHMYSADELERPPCVTAGVMVFPTWISFINYPDEAQESNADWGRVVTRARDGLQQEVWHLQATRDIRAGEELICGSCYPPEDDADPNEDGMRMSGVNMSGMNMSGMNMSGMNMSGMNMSGMGMSGMSTGGRSMRGMSMSGMNMSGMSMMSGMNMSGMSMKGGATSRRGMSGVDAGGQSTAGGEDTASEVESRQPRA